MVMMYTYDITIKPFQLILHNATTAKATYTLDLSVMIEDIIFNSFCQYEHNLPKFELSSIFIKLE